MVRESLEIKRFYGFTLGSANICNKASRGGLRYIHHSAHIAPGRDDLFNLIRTLPDTLKYENQLIVAEGNYVMAHGRFSGNGRPAAWIAADIVRIEDGRLAEHWDVLQDEASKNQSLSGLPMFGDGFPTNFPHLPNAQGDEI